jgi:hypothetical protein
MKQRRSFSLAVGPPNRGTPPARSTSSPSHVDRSARRGGIEAHIGHGKLRGYATGKLIQAPQCMRVPSHARPPVVTGADRSVPRRHRIIRGAGGILTMNPLLHLVGNFWWLVFPLGGAIGGGLRAIAAANERRAERRLEPYRLKQQAKIAMAMGAPHGPRLASARAQSDKERYRRELAKLIEEHGRTDARWLDYELDIAKLLDFPMMTDMRDPLTIAFHKAKRHADLLRPERPEDLLGDRTAQLEYRNAVHEYISAFEIAEAEAIRRRRSDFSVDEQQRLARARNLLHLARDAAATPQERQNAYARASRELDGLIVLPASARASIERCIAGQIEA